MGLLDSWRSSPRASERAGSDTRLTSDEVIARAQRRFTAMGRDELLDFLDANVGAIGRDLGAYRRTGEKPFLNEALLAATVELLGVQELDRRNAR